MEVLNGFTRFCISLLELKSSLAIHPSSATNYNAEISSTAMYIIFVKITCFLKFFTD